MSFSPSLFLSLFFFLSGHLFAPSLYPSYLVHSLTKHLQWQLVHPTHSECYKSLKSNTYVSFFVTSIEFQLWGRHSDDRAKSAQSSSTEGGSFCQMPPWCQNETQVQWTFHLIQWLSFQIVHLVEVINKAVMYLCDPQYSLGFYVPIIPVNNDLQHSIMDFFWIAKIT